MKSYPTFLSIALFSLLTCGFGLLITDASNRIPHLHWLIDLGVLATYTGLAVGLSFLLLGVADLLGFHLIGPRLSRPSRLKRLLKKINMGVLIVIGVFMALDGLLLMMFSGSESPWAMVGAVLGIFGILGLPCLALLFRYVKSGDNQGLPEG